MALKNYIAPILKYWWLLAAAALVAMISSFIVSRFQPPIYRTQATLLVGRAVFEANPSSGDLYLGQQLASYYADFGNRTEVQDATMEALGLNRLPQYTILPVPNSQLIEIVVIDTVPARAQAVANELANQLIRRSPASNRSQGSERQEFINGQIAYLEGKITETQQDIEDADIRLSEMNSARQIADAQTQIAALQDKLAQLQTNYAALLSNTEQGAANTLTLVESAILPITPIGPQTGVVIVLSAMVAIGLATASAYLLEFLDDTFKTPEEITYLLKLPVLANISVMRDKINSPSPHNASLFQSLAARLSGKSRAKNKEILDPDIQQNLYIYASANPRSMVADEFRSLRISLDFAGVDLALKTILVTSPDAAEGKTSVATNLAIVMAQGGKKVILLDTDFRRPSVDTHFQIPNEYGLSDVFREYYPLADVLQPSSEELLSIITTGRIPPNPVDLLSSHRIDQILTELKNISDVVIIDGPPLIFPDSLALSTKVDSVLMVVRHSVTRKSATQVCLKQLTQVGARVSGVVLNEVPSKSMTKYGNYKSYYKKVEGETKTQPG